MVCAVLVGMNGPKDALVPRWRMEACCADLVDNVERAGVCFQKWMVGRQWRGGMEWGCLGTSVRI
jgi:hypothetical protein